MIFVQSHAAAAAAAADDDDDDDDDDFYSAICPSVQSVFTLTATFPVCNESWRQRQVAYIVTIL